MCWETNESLDRIPGLLLQADDLHQSQSLNTSCSNEIMLIGREERFSGCWCFTEKTLCTTKLIFIKPSSQIWFMHMGDVCHWHGSDTSWKERRGSFNTPEYIIEQSGIYQFMVWALVRTQTWGMELYIIVWCCKLRSRTSAGVVHYTCCVAFGPFYIPAMSTSIPPPRWLTCGFPATLPFPWLNIPWKSDFFLAPLSLCSSLF